MSVQVRGFLKARRDRALGSILGYMEEEYRGRFSKEEWSDVRGTILDAINGYHDSVLDLMKSEDGTTVRNEEVVALLERVERALTPPRRTRPTSAAPV